MADKKLDSIVQIDGENYEVVAETAKKVANVLTIKVIKDGEITPVKFDGSKAEEITIGDANKIKVDINPGTEEATVKYATITISKNDPGTSDGDTGNIWFKY
jgi:hypothetical protein